jgi:hypothetical protein
MRKPNVVRTLSILPGLILLAATGLVHAETWNDSYDRPGGDYRAFGVEGYKPDLCEAACNKEPQCKAWVFVKPGRDKGDGRCYLKNTVPQAVYNPRCITSVKGSGMPKPASCPPLNIVTNSPLPPTVIGAEYNTKIAAVGGVPPLVFCPMMTPPDGTPPRCDRSPGQRFSMPLGLTLSPDGRISGHVQCLNPEKAGTNCGAGYRPLRIQVRDSCPGRPQVTSKELWIDIKPSP